MKYLSELIWDWGVIKQLLFAALVIIYFLKWYKMYKIIDAEYLKAYTQINQMLAKYHLSTARLYVTIPIGLMFVAAFNYYVGLVLMLSIIWKISLFVHIKHYR